MLLLELKSSYIVDVLPVVDDDFDVLLVATILLDTAWSPNANRGIAKRGTHTPASVCLREGDRLSDVTQMV